MKKVLSFILSLLIVLFVVLIYSRFVGTVGLDTKEIQLSTEIANSYDGLKVIHFADLHYKKVITEKRVKELVNEIRRNKPDIILFTGDLLDKDYNMTNADINFLIEEFSKLESTYGNYAIFGDQDKYQEEVVKNIYIQSGFTLLENESVLIYNENNDKILLGGLDSLLEGDANISETIDSTIDTEDVSYRIIFVHEPDYIPTILEKYPKASLILSSHSIHGSIRVPILQNLLLPNGAKKYHKNVNKIENTDIFVTNGIGVNQVNFRLFNTPSISLYRIQRSN